MRDRLLTINPAMAIETYCEDIFQWEDEDLHALVDRADVIVATTDRAAVQQMANEQAVLRQRRFVAAGCHEEARSGEVFTWFPGEGLPCYACLRDARIAPTTEGRHDYAFTDDDDDYTGEPGLHAAIAQVANAAAQAVLSLLLVPEPDSELGRVFRPNQQLLMMGTARAAGYFRFQRPFQAWMVGFRGSRRDCILAAEHAKEGGR